MYQPYIIRALDWHSPPTYSHNMQGGIKFWDPHIHICSRYSLYSVRGGPYLFTIAHERYMYQPYTIRALEWHSSSSYSLHMQGPIKFWNPHIHICSRYSLYNIRWKNPIIAIAHERYMSQPYMFRVPGWHIPSSYSHHMHGAIKFWDPHNHICSRYSLYSVRGGPYLFTHSSPTLHVSALYVSSTRMAHPILILPSYARCYQVLGPSQPYLFTLFFLQCEGRPIPFHS